MGHTVALDSEDGRITQENGYYPDQGFSKCYFELTSVTIPLTSTDAFGYGIHR
jgi:hypothetical protein